jgi:hypothetical protein
VPGVEGLLGRRGEQEGHLGGIASRPKRHPREATELAHVGEAQLLGIGGHLIEQGHEGLRDAREAVLEDGERPGVARRQGVHRLDGGGPLAVQVEQTGVGVDVQRRPRLIHLKPAAAQIEVLPDRVAQHRQHVGAGRGAETRGELLGDAGAPHDAAALQHEGPQARACEVEGGRETIVPTAHDDSVVAFDNGPFRRVSPRLSTVYASASRRCKHGSEAIDAWACVRDIMFTVNR